MVAFDHCHVHAKYDFLFGEISLLIAYRVSCIAIQCKPHKAISSCFVLRFVLYVSSTFHALCAVALK